MAHQFTPVPPHDSTPTSGTAPTSASGTGSLRDRKKAETKDRLAIAAVTKLVEVGSDGATIAAIADSANVSPRTFHNYFANREEAYLHFCTGYVLHVKEKIDALPAELSPLDVIEEFMREAYQQPDHHIYSFATLKYVGEHLKTHFTQLENEMGRKELLKCLPEGTKNIVDPLVKSLQRRSHGALSTFQVLLLIGQSLVVADTIKDNQDVFDTFGIQDNKTELELLEEGFNTLRRGFMYYLSPGPSHTT